jgi:hypothetical protein
VNDDPLAFLFSFMIFITAAEISFLLSGIVASFWSSISWLQKASSNKGNNGLLVIIEDLSVVEGLVAVQVPSVLFSSYLFSNSEILDLKFSGLC